MTAACPADPREAAGGTLVLVVGPSGSGKDSLIRLAREQLAADPRFVFPRRVVTRPSSDSEDNVEVDTAGFDAMAAQGAFTASWEAHGLRYGIPASVEAELAAGRSVVCNVSRTAIPTLRTRFPQVAVIEVTASPEILAQRLAARRREADGATGERLARSSRLSRIGADLTIRNEGPLEDAGHRFLEALRRLA